MFNTGFITGNIKISYSNQNIIIPRIPNLETYFKHWNIMNRTLINKFPASNKVDKLVDS